METYVRIQNWIAEQISIYPVLVVYLWPASLLTVVFMMWG